MPDDYVVCKLDFSNAFNCLHRDTILNEVAKHIPEIYKFCHLAYSKASVLRFNTDTVMSECGVQQGDPLGSLLFCLTLQPILQSITADLTIGFLDDLTLGGNISTIARDIQLIKQASGDIGLNLNATKCELITNCSGGPPHEVTHNKVFANFVHLSADDATLLGSPLLAGSALTASLLAAVQDLAKAIDRLRHLHAHDALILLRACFSAPKLTFILRCTPCHSHPTLQEFDSLLKRGISLITNSAISDLQMMQASLPVKDGGLGIRSVASLALPAFLASAASTHELQNKILQQASFVLPETFIKDSQLQWQSVTSLTCPEGPASCRQSSWDRPLINLDKATIFNSQPDNYNRARLAAVSTSHSGDWLFALPISSCGLRLDDEAIRVAVGLRLGINLCEPHTCPCGATVDARGSHGLSCRSNSGRTSRHHQLNDTIQRALSRCHIPAIKEPSGLSRSDGKRPDGMTLIPWSGGKCLLWDVTVVDTLATSYLPSTSASAGSAAENAAQRKELKYSALTSSYDFIPLAFETLGPINDSAICFLSALGQRTSAVTHDSRETSFLYQRLSILVQRFNAVCFRNTFYSTSSDLDD
jgi:hypothetical protein